MTKQRKTRIPKTKRLSDGSISIDGFIAPAPKHAPPVPARMPCIWDPSARTMDAPFVGASIINKALQYSKPPLVFNLFDDIEPSGRNK